LIYTRKLVLLYLAGAVSYACKMFMKWTPGRLDSPGAARGQKPALSGSVLRESASIERKINKDKLQVSATIFVGKAWSQPEWST
jgi:hypothetical protein